VRLDIRFMIRFAGLIQSNGINKQIDGSSNGMIEEGIVSCMRETGSACGIQYSLFMQ